MFKCLNLNSLLVKCQIDNPSPGDCIASFKKASPAKVFKLGDVLLLALSGKLTFISQGIGIIR